MFLVEETSKEAPGISGFDHWYTSLSLDNGIFELSADGVATPRMQDAFATPATPAPTYDLDSLRKLVGSG
jgi:hypothetical protein